MKTLENIQTKLPKDFEVQEYQQDKHQFKKAVKS